MLTPRVYRDGENVVSHDGFFEGCHHDGPCLDPRECQCQNTEFADEVILKGRRVFAYDLKVDYPLSLSLSLSLYIYAVAHVSVLPFILVQGRYILPDDSRMAVFECNQVCHCDLTCQNRVSQRPRDVPLEVFKCRDPKKGWGVRATIPVEKGKVLGVFTG